MYRATDNILMYQILPVKDIYVGKHFEGQNHWWDF